MSVRGHTSIYDGVCMFLLTEDDKRNEEEIGKQSAGMSQLQDLLDELGPLDEEDTHSPAAPVIDIFTRKKIA